MFTHLGTFTDEQVRKALHRRIADSLRDAGRCESSANLTRTSKAERRILLAVVGNSHRPVRIPVMLNPEHANYMGHREIHRDVPLLELLTACTRNAYPTYDSRHVTADFAMSAATARERILKSMTKFNQNFYTLALA